METGLAIIKQAILVIKLPIGLAFAELIRVGISDNALIVEPALTHDGALSVLLSSGRADLFTSSHDDHAAADNFSRVPSDDFAIDALSSAVAF